MNNPKIKTSPAIYRQVTLFDLLILIGGAREDARDGLGSFDEMLEERILEEMDR